MAALLKQLEAWQAQKAVDIGRGQADVSRAKHGTPFPLSNEAKLDSGRAAARNMVEGTIRKNRALRELARLKKR